MEIKKGVVDLVGSECSKNWSFMQMIDISDDYEEENR